jgi:hypothetical protein
MGPNLSELTAQYADLSARRAMTMHLIAKGLTHDAADYEHELRARVGNREHLQLLVKAAVGAITDDALQPLTVPWADLATKQTVIGRLPFVRRVPPGVPLTIVDVAAAANFVPEGSPIPVTKPSITDAALVPSGIKAIVPYTEEAFRKSEGNLPVLLERDLTRAAALAEDRALLDSQAAVAGHRPASVLFGKVAVADVSALVAAVRGGDAVAPSFITSPTGARSLTGARDATSGELLFPNVNLLGGSILGVPLIISGGSPDNILTLLDGDALLVVGGTIDLDTARDAAFAFDSDPETGPTSEVSLYQTDSFAIRIVRWTGWQLAWADGAAFMNLPV